MSTISMRVAQVETLNPLIRRFTQQPVQGGALPTVDAGSRVRVIHAFPGLVDDEWNQNMPPPKLSPDAPALAIVEVLRGGVEVIHPGDIAQEWLARRRENPKVLERELAAGGS